MSTTTVSRPEAGVRTPVAERVHRLHRFAGRLHEVLDELGEPSLWSMDESELVETALELHGALPRLAERMLAALAQVDLLHAAAGQGATSTAAWWAEQTRTTRPAAHRQVATAQALLAHEPTRQALAAGRLSDEHARIVTDAVDGLPAGVGQDQRARAEHHLLEEARHHDAVALRHLARHLLEVIDPDGADERLAALLEAEETRASRTTTLHLRDDGHGRCHGSFTIPSLHGAMLATALQAIANPALPDPIARHDEAGRRIPTPEVLGQAFGRYLELMPADRLPTTGGVNATVVVTIPLETLEGRLRSASLGDGLEISAGQARRLACSAGMIPAVLGTDSTVLDLGRRTRLHTRKQRRAMALQQDGTCAVTGCDRPSTWCDAHHLTPWSHGGPTTVDNGVLICPRHHTLAHDDRFVLTRHGPGAITFHRRT
jgi:hypothetical protein